MKKRMTKLVSVLLALSLAAGLAACGSSTTTTTTDTDGDAANTAASSGVHDVVEAARENQSGNTAGNSDDPVQQEPSARGESTIITCATGDPGGFDLFASTAMNTEYGIYQSLLTYGYGGYEPGIISEYEIAEDSMSCSFTIDDDIYTVDGYHVTASDVLWSVEQHQSGYCTNYAAIFDMATSYVVDDYHGVLGFSETYYPFMLDNFCHLGVTTQEGYENAEDHYYYTAAGSTGPYKVVSYDEGVQIVLTKFENYRGGYATQNVDNIIVKIVTEASQRLLMLESGEIDVIVSPNSSDMDHISALDGIQTSNEFSHMQYYMAFNVVEESPLQNQLVRQAICYAIDNEALCTAVYKGLRSPAISPINPIVQEWSDQVAIDAESNIYSYDLEKAKELMAEAGYEDGFTAQIAYSSNEAGLDLAAQVIQGMLLQLNITLEIQPYDKTSFKTLTLGTSGWDICLDKCKLQDSVLFPFKDKSNANVQSVGGWYDEEFQTLLERALYTLDMNDTLRMVEIYNDLACHYHLVYNTAQFGYREGIEDFRTRGDNQLCPGDWTYDYDACDWLFD
ncbi:MAG: ABC transporter substrate-binding protein [Oscillospiraceae bacterium]|nr:ABC transporter substrate-binding protein [Oscillospiraceae bacterium]